MPIIWRYKLYLTFKNNNKHILIAHVLDPRYKMEHLRAILIEIGGYTGSEVEKYINNIWQKISTSTIKIDKEPILNVSFFKKTDFKEMHISTETIDYKLVLY